MAQTLDTKGNVIQNGFSTNLTPSQLSNSNIPVSSISPTTPINITPQVEVPPTTYTTPVNNVAIDTTQGKLLAEQQRAEQVASQEAQNARNQTMGIANDISVSQLNNVKDVAGTYAGQGVNTLYNQVQDLNAQAIGLQNEASAIPIQIQQQATGQGVTDRGVAPIQAAKLRENALKALSLGQQYAIASGNYEKAKNYADQLIETKYSAEEARIKSLQTQQDSIDKNILTPAEQKRLEAAKQVTKLQEQEIADKKATEIANNNIYLKVLEAGTATPEIKSSIADAIKSGKSTSEILALAGNSIAKPDQEVIKQKIGDSEAVYLLDKNTGKMTRVLGGGGGTGTGTGTGGKKSGVAETIIASGKFTKDQATNIRNAINSGEDPTTVIKNNAKNIMTATLATDLDKKEAALDQLKVIDGLLKEYYANGGKSGIFNGNYEKTLNKVGSINDPKLVDVSSKIALAMQSYRLAVTGTAASVQEDSRIDAIFPGITNGELLNNTKTKSLVNSFERDIDAAYERTIGKTAYNQLKSEGQVNNQPKTTPKGSMDDRTYVEKVLSSQNIPYDTIVNATPKGQIPVIDNKTGQTGHIEIQLYQQNPSAYTKI